MCVVEIFLTKFVSYIIFEIFNSMFSVLFIKELVIQECACSMAGRENKCLIQRSYIFTRMTSLQFKSCVTTNSIWFAISCLFRACVHTHTPAGQRCEYLRLEFTGCAARRMIIYLRHLSEKWQFSSPTAHGGLLFSIYYVCTRSCIPEMNPETLAHSII